MTSRHAFLHQLFDFTNEAPIAELFHGTILSYRPRACGILCGVVRRRHENEVLPQLPASNQLS
jgi:hypothetical protein